MNKNRYILEQYYFLKENLKSCAIIILLNSENDREKNKYSLKYKTRALLTCTVTNYSVTHEQLNVWSSGFR